LSDARDAAVTAGARILLAPVTITPTKPLTPSHIKGLLYVDVLYRATSLVADVTYLYNHRTYDVTLQTLGFWEYLDRTVGEADYRGWSEEEIGERYVRFHAEAGSTSLEALLPYREAVERDGWVHPASRRLLSIWREHYALLGLFEPGLLAPSPPPGLSVDEVVERLGARDLCVDLRPVGGGVFLDLTAQGLPLRQVVTPDGHANYLVCMLRELLPLAGRFDRVLLVHDRELSADYQLVRRVLEAFGSEASSIAIDRVPIERRVQSSRHGGWRGHTVAETVRPLSGEFDSRSLRLGLRIYFIAVLDRAASGSFDVSTLRRCLRRAERIVANATGGPPAGQEAYLGELGRRGWVDPLRLTSDLLSRRWAALAGSLLDRVFV
jgi:hypothetical protein